MKTQDELKEKLEGLKSQLKQAEILHYKLQGAIEFTESILEKEKKKK